MTSRFGLLALLSVLVLPALPSTTTAGETTETPLLAKDFGLRDRDRERERSFGDRGDERATRRERLDARGLPASGWGMDFQIDGASWVRAYRGATIAFRSQVSEGAAWRLALVLRTHKDEMDDVIAVGDSVVDFRNQRTDLQIYRATISFLSYPSPAREVKFYYGIGPTVSFQREALHAQIGYPMPQAFYDSYSKLWSAGVSATAGAQWFARRSISLYAEYGLIAEYWERIGHRDDLSVPSGFVRRGRFNSRGFTVGGNDAAIGLAVYF